MQKYMTAHRDMGTKRYAYVFKKVAVLFILFLTLTGLFFLSGRSEALRNSAIQNDVRELTRKNASFGDISQYFKNLAEKESAEYAFTVLAQASLPTNIDIHLLGHIIGDELYKQQGLKGISICTDDFRNACSHSIVIGTLLEKGEEALSDISEICRKAPGGSGAYTMCFHGLGHGVLAYTDYELEKAVLLCKKTGTPEYNNREYMECVGGTAMEMIGGVHDKAVRIEKSKEYFKENDALYPCNADFMPVEVRAICYLYLTPHLFEAAGGDLGNPTPRDFEGAFQLCDVIPEEDTFNRDACFGGFGKEFTVLANDRDVRNIERMNAQQLKTVYDWCTLAEHEDGILSCINSAVKSLYWGGENDSLVAIRLCRVIDSQKRQGFCFERLINEVNFYISDVAYRREFCTQVPTAYDIMCKQTLYVQ